MDAASLVDRLQADAAAVQAAAAAAPEAAVPTCPGWDRRKVVAHLCVPYGWVLAQLDAGPGQRRGFRDAERPPPRGDVVAFYGQQTDRLVAALRAVDPEQTWPTWAGPRPATWFARRMAHETAVHRFDVAGGPVDAEAAVDGIDELLDELAPLIPADQLAAAAGTVHLHATDPGVEGEWVVSLGPDGITTTRTHAKGDVAVRGSAGDLFLWVWNRVPLDERFEVFGDRDLAGRWAQALAI